MNMQQNRLNQTIPFNRYIVTGVIVTLVDLCALYALREVAGLPLRWSVIWAFLLANNLSFIINRTWTFRNSRASFVRQYTKFLLTSAVGLTLTVFLMWLLAEKWLLFSTRTDKYYLLCKLLTSGVIVQWNFLSNKLWTFAGALRLPAPERPKTEYAYFLSILIPAYNEQKRIIPTVEAVINYITQRKLNAEILIVDDGSTDHTVDACTTRFEKVPHVRILRGTENRGKGHAIRRGIEAATGEYILFTDADNATPIEEFDRFRPRLTRDAVLIGSRYLQPHRVEIRQPWYRIMLSRAANLLIRFFVLDGVRDTQCGFKVFPSSTGKHLAAMQKIDRFAFDIEFLVLAQLCGYHIEEIPVRWLDSPHSRLRPIRDTVWTFLDLIRIKMNIWRRVYSDA